MIYNEMSSYLELCDSLCNYTPYMLYIYEGWNFNSGNYLFTTDTK